MRPPRFQTDSGPTSRRDERCESQIFAHDPGIERRITNYQFSVSNFKLGPSNWKLEIENWPLAIAWVGTARCAVPAGSTAPPWRAQWDRGHRSAMSLPKLGSAKALILTALLGMIACTGCGGGGGGGGGGPAAGPPPTAVDMITVSTGEIVESLSSLGTVQANESVALKPEADGVVSAIQFTEGQVVETGQRLFELTSGKEAAMLARAQAEAEIARVTLERSRTLAGTKAISQQEIDDWKARLAAREADVALYKEQLRDTQVSAPFKGVVGGRNVSLGQYVNSSVVLLTLVDNSRVKVTYYVPEKELARIRAGQSVALRVAAYPGKKFEGEVDLIDPVVNPSTRMAAVRAIVPNPENLLKPGMFAQVDTVVGRRPEALVIPESAVVPSLRGFSVFLVKEGSVTLTQVEIGVRQPGKVEIKHGLSAGDLIVVGGIQKIVDGAKVVSGQTPPLAAKPAEAKAAAETKPEESKPEPAKHE